jgi:hypothetical protein
VRPHKPCRKSPQTKVRMHSSPLHLPFALCGLPRRFRPTRLCGCLLLLAAACLIALQWSTGSCRGQTPPGTQPTAGLAGSCLAQATPLGFRRHRPTTPSVWKARYGGLACLPFA